MFLPIKVLIESITTIVPETGLAGQYEYFEGIFLSFNVGVVTALCLCRAVRIRDIRENAPGQNLSLEVMLSDTTNSLLPIEIQNLENRPTCP